MSGWRAIMSDVNYGISNVGTVMTSCAGSQHLTPSYHAKLERVKFGVPLDQVCRPDLPGPLLLMLLKLNKEGPFKKEVFRAPGHQASMKKLIHFLQQGRLVNIQNYSLNTIASVMKKFLRKIPGGIFGADNEAAIFKIIKMEDKADQMKAVHGLMTSLPLYSQHLLVLLFGTFRVIHTNSVVNETNMTAEALGVSVAPSFFHTCVAAGKTARMEDVERFKLATRATSYFIQHFGMRELFGRENYEYYARLTGRILKVEDEWIFFTYPLDYLGVVRSDIDIDCRPHHGFRSSHHDVEPTGSLEMIPENCPLDPSGRLSISLDTEHCMSSLESAPASTAAQQMVGLRSSTLDTRRQHRSSSNTEARSFVCLPQVHQKQTERMRARSDWFLSDWPGSANSGLVTYRAVARGGGDRERGQLAARPASLLSPSHLSLSHSSPLSTPAKLPLTGSGGCLLEPDLVTGKPPDGQVVALRRKLSDKDKERRLVRRSSSKRKDKENGGGGGGGGGGGEKCSSQTGPALKRQSSGDSASHLLPCLSRAASQDSPKGRHSRGSSFDQESPGGGPVETSSCGPVSRSLPRI